MLCLICARNPCVPAIYGAWLAVCCWFARAWSLAVMPWQLHSLLQASDCCLVCCMYRRCCQTCSFLMALLPSAAVPLFLPPQVPPPLPPSLPPPRRHARLLPHRAAALCHGAAAVQDAGPGHRAAAHDRRGCALLRGLQMCAAKRAAHICCPKGFAHAHAGGGRRWWVASKECRRTAERCCRRCAGMAAALLVVPCASCAQACYQLLCSKRLLQSCGIGAGRLFQPAAAAAALACDMSSPLVGCALR